MNIYEERDFSILEDILPISIDLLKKDNLTVEEWKSYRFILMDYYCDITYMEPHSYFTDMISSSIIDVFDIFNNEKHFKSFHLSLNYYLSDFCILKSFLY